MESATDEPRPSSSGEEDTQRTAPQESDISVSINNLPRSSSAPGTSKMVESRNPTFSSATGGSKQTPSAGSAPPTYPPPRGKVRKLSLDTSGHSMASLPSKLEDNDPFKKSGEIQYKRPEDSLPSPRKSQTSILLSSPAAQSKSWNSGFSAPAPLSETPVVMDPQSGHSTTSSHGSGVGVMDRNSAHSAASAPSSTVNTSPLKGLRRSWQVRTTGVPPAFRSSAEKKVSHPESNSSLNEAKGVSAEDLSTTRRSWRPPKPTYSSDSDVDLTSDREAERRGGGDIRRPGRPPKPTRDSDSDPSSKHPIPPPPPPSRAPFISPITKRKIELDSSLPIHFVRISAANDDRSKVSTYDALLEEIVASDKPEAQQALNVLATMKRNGVTPGDTTWRLIEKCSQIRKGGYKKLEEGTGKQLVSLHVVNSDSPVEVDDFAVERFSLYSDAAAGGIDQSSDHGDRPRKNWNMEQDLSQLSPAFRSSIVAMLRKNNGNDVKDSPKTQRNPAHVRAHTGSDGSVHSNAGLDPVTAKVESKNQDRGGEAGPSKSKESARYTELCFDRPVSDRKKRWSSKGILNTGESVLEKILPPKNVDNPKDEKCSSLYAEHGEVQYMRPDGQEATTRYKIKSSEKKDDEASVDIADQISQIDTTDLGSYNGLLAAIANSHLPDKANRAGKVLKNMKENSIPPNNTTRALLESCTRLEEKPIEPKPHEELEIEVVEDPLLDYEQHTTTVQVIKKRVRFAAKNSFRFIRRRRSISSMERWDDPLTPPKRISEPVDLAPSRFSSGLRDDRPSLPRRSESLSSLLSGGSDRSDRTGSSSDTEDSYYDSPRSDRFKLPFSDNSPQKVKGKGSQTRGLEAPKRSKDPGMPRQPSRPKGGTKPQPPKRPVRGDTPITPVRRRGFQESISPISDKEIIVEFSAASLGLPILSAPPPPMSSPLYATPPLRRRRVKRRSSISGTERRATTPLTPPRKISEPLNLFISNSSKKSLKKTKSADDVMLSPQTKAKKPLQSYSTHSVPAKFSESTASKPPKPKARQKVQDSPVTPDKLYKPKVPLASDRFEQPKESKSPKPKARPKVEAPTIEEDPLDTASLLTSIYRHNNSVAENWRTIDLPEKMRLRNLSLDDEMTDIPQSLRTFENATRSFDADDLGVQRFDKMSRRKFVGVGPTAKGPKAQGRGYMPNSKPPASPSWARVRIRTTDHGGTIKKGGSVTNIMSNSSDHGPSYRSPHPKKDGIAPVAGHNEERPK